jgi:hypothetical protein
MTFEMFENNWFYMKYIGKYLSVKMLLTCECSIKWCVTYTLWKSYRSANFIT